MPSGLTPGDAIWMRFPYSDPPKKKLCLCVCIEENIFLVVSSKAYSRAPADSQIRLYEEDLAVLSHQSFLDASKYYDDFSPQEIANGIRNGVCSLSQSARARIKHVVSGQRYLIERVKKKILNNL